MCSSTDFAHDTDDFIDYWFWKLFFDDNPEVVLLARRAGWDATAVESVSDVVRHPRLRSFFRDFHAG